MTKSKCPIERALNRLKRYKDILVPDIVRWKDGVPDFRDIDHEKYLRHYRFRLCAICGTKLKFHCYWIGGPSCAVQHYFVDGPMHGVCAALAIQICPFLNKSTRSYRGELPAMSLQKADKRPEKMCLMRGLTSAYELRQIAEDSIAFWTGDQLTLIREF